MVTTETIPHSLLDLEEKKKVNFQTGKIKVLYTIDVGTAKSGSEQFLSVQEDEANLVS
jgi:hypothetical protein